MMEGIRKRKRITVKLNCPNPMFERWLTEWRDEAKRRESKMEHCFSNALRSLQKYPLPLDTGKDCKVLRGFGDKLCKMLDEKLKDYNGGTCSAKSDATGTRYNMNIDRFPNVSKAMNISTVDSSKKSNKSAEEAKKEYVPQPGSGPFAILAALHELSQAPQYVGHSSKLDVIKAAQTLCDTSFTKPEAGSRYTAWSSMRTLLQKKLVTKSSSPAKFSLTDDGALLAVRLNSTLKKLENRKSNEYASMEVDGDVEIIDIDTNTSNDIRKPGPSSSKEVNCDNVIDGLASITGTYSVNTKINPASDKYVNRHAEAIYNKMGSAQSEKNERMPPPKSKQSKRAVSKTTSKKQLSSCASQVSLSSQEEETVFLMPNEFDIVLLVDTQETSGSRSRSEDPIIVELRKHNVHFEVRHLKVGDYSWICRHNTSNRELVLPYVVERKRMDDLGHSIKDGRFHEQKFRLKQCGIQNLVYLIENYGKNEYTGLPITTLYQAAINTMVQDNFVVKIVDNMQETVSYLSAFSSLLNKYYKAKTLMSSPKENLTPSTLDDDLIPLLTFKEFSKTGTKNKQLKVKDLFIRQLLQIKGMSVEKALGIVNVYPTPKALKMAYSGKSAGEAEKLLSSVPFGNLKKNIGPVLSKTVCQLFTLKQF